MERCEMVERCIFFNDKMQDYPFAAEQMKKLYCLGDNLDCARHRVLDALGKEHVPGDLFPNDVARAARVIAGADDRPFSV
jgi:hypothetical protein